MPPTLLLPVCKHVERSGARKACRSQVSERGHKRGYVSVACKEGHQWVWCEHCCNCPTNRGENKLKGCILPSHWMERDSFDTGKRNHMQCHLPSGARGATAAPKPSIRNDVGIVLHPAHVGLGEPATTCATSPTDSLRTKRRRDVTADGAAFESYLSTVIGRPNPNKLQRMSPDLQGSGPIEVPSETTPVLPKMEPSLLGATVPLALLRECKHVDRKQNRKQCPFALHLRGHKRGHLAVSCEAGHQWVWCFFCCDCPRSGLGCANAFHWMERDSFDTGRRNHMQRHMAGYDAKSEWSNPVNIAALANGAIMFPMYAQAQALAISASLQCHDAKPNPEPAGQAGEGGQGNSPLLYDDHSDSSDLSERCAVKLTNPTHGGPLHVCQHIPSAPRSTAEYLQRSLPPAGADGAEDEETNMASIENLGSISKAAEVLLALQGLTQGKSSAEVEAAGPSLLALAAAQTAPS